LSYIGRPCKEGGRKKKKGVRGRGGEERGRGKERDNGRKEGRERGREGGREGLRGKSRPFTGSDHTVVLFISLISHPSSLSVFTTLCNHLTFGI
jgi:hypothetical protein